VSSLGTVIGRNIEKYMEIRKLNIKELSEKADIHRNTLTGYIKGTTGISLEMVSTVAAALGVTETDLTYPGATPEPVVIQPTVEDALKIVEMRVRAAARFSPEALEILLGLSDLQIQTIEENVLKPLAEDAGSDASEESA
jgi:transcriptional regulator with XRE-family HTH domain